MICAVEFRLYVLMFLSLAMGRIPALGKLRGSRTLILTFEPCGVLVLSLKRQDFGDLEVSEPPRLQIFVLSVATGRIWAPGKLSVSRPLIFDF